ncbi:hypothetical protein HPB50_012656 [Hyalomma asiaticum]|uniref:Uncharacterized protein n=1 Tax=Hyalomma asiaticum TaxID=266040 RepID=A0ACB7RQK4_HYAAI|nr:hypothetical protein HPB50_012656 [Hyalomma asiaticum]
MDLELHARPPDPAQRVAAASRKRNGTGSDSDIELLCHRGRKAKRRLVSTSSNSKASTVRSSKHSWLLTILFVPASIDERRSRRRRYSKPSRTSSPCEPCAKLPPPLPPRPHAVGSKDEPVSSSGTRDAWPELPKLQVPDERRQPSTAKDNLSVPYKLTDEDKQGVAIISSLASAIRLHLDKMQTPTARSALQMMDAIDPVLASLQKSST